MAGLGECDVGPLHPDDEEVRRTAPTRTRKRGRRTLRTHYHTERRGCGKTGESILIGKEVWHGEGAVPMEDEEITSSPSSATAGRGAARGARSGIKKPLICYKSVASGNNGNSFHYHQFALLLKCFNYMHACFLSRDIISCNMQ